MIAEFPAPGEQPVGGPQVAVTRLVPKLVERGIEVVVLAPDSARSSETTTQLESGGVLVCVPAGRRWTLARRLQPWRKRVVSTVKSLGVDVVHGQGLLPGGIAAADVDGCPVVATARGNERVDTEVEYSGVGGKARAYVRERLMRAAIARADVVIGVNPDWTVNLPQKPKRFVYVPNMIDEELFGRSCAPEPGLVLFAGGARAIKGWALLAQAWPRVRKWVPHARLNVVGWPVPQVPEGIPVEHRESLIVEGWLSSSELADRMARAAALVIPSQFEVSPIVLAEAWALRLPVVAVPVGGIPALARGAAILVQREPDALAAGIVRALGSEADVDRLVEEGRRRADAHRPDAVADAHLALYTELLNEAAA